MMSSPPAQRTSGATRLRAAQARSVLLPLAFAIPLIQAACVPHPASPPQPPTKIAQVPAEPPPPSCISQETIRQLACPAGAPPRLASSAPVTWPSGDHLFHRGYDLPWTQPSDPRALHFLVGRSAMDPTDAPATMSRLELADRAFDAAAAPEAQDQEAKIRQSKWRAAAVAYAEFLDAAGPEHRLVGYALHRQRRALWNATDADAALARLKALFQHVRANPDSPGASGLDTLGRGDLAPLYADSTHGPAEAASWVGGVARTSQESTPILEAIGQSYLAAGRYDEARALFAELQARSSGSGACAYSARQLTVSIVQHPSNGKGLIAALQDLLALRDSVKNSAATPADKQRCTLVTLAPIVELATAWRTDAVGWKGATGSRDTRVANDVALLYDLLSNRFTAADLDTSPLPGVPAQSRPSIDRVGLARAQLSGWRYQFVECGQAYERVRETSSSAAVRATASEGAVACYLQALRVHRWPSSRAGRREPVEGELRTPLARLPEATRHYLCTFEPSDADPVGTAKRLEVELLRGRVAFMDGQWERSAAALTRLAFDQGHSQAREAAAMYAIALHQLHTGGDDVCGADFAHVKGRLTQLHCASANDDPILDYLALPGTTTRNGSAGLTPCEALRAVGDPPPPPLAPPTRPAEPRQPILRIDSTSVDGAVLPEVVRWVLGLHAPRLRACYAATLRRDAFFVPAGGKVDLRFTIGRDGSVMRASTHHRGFANAHLTQCLQRALYGMSFAQPEGGPANVMTSATLSLDRGLRLSPRVHVHQSVD